MLSAVATGQSLPGGRRRRTARARAERRSLRAKAASAGRAPTSTSSPAGARNVTSTSVAPSRAAHARPAATLAARRVVRGVERAGGRCEAERDLEVRLRVGVAGVEPHGVLELDDGPVDRVRRLARGRVDEL